MPPLDPVLGDAIGQRHRDELAAGDWHGTQDLLERTRDPMLRAFYVDTLTSIQGRPAWIDEWVSQRPDSSIPVLFRGSHSVYWAWEARGGGRANTVADESWPIFYERLVDADGDLSRAAEVDTDDPTPHQRRIWVAIGLQLGQDEVRRRFDQATSNALWQQGAHATLIQGITRKWGGSHDAAIAHGRSVLAQAPDGEPALRVVCDAHLERWLDFDVEKAPADVRRAYFLSDAVKADVRQAFARYLGSPALRLTPWTHADRNVFATCFGLMNDVASMVEQVRSLRPEQQLMVPWGLQWVRSPLRRMIAFADRNPHLAQRPAPT
jgi:hypothetical protein